jgi:hypothetical protein
VVGGVACGKALRLGGVYIDTRQLMAANDLGQAARRGTIWVVGILAAFGILSQRTTLLARAHAIHVRRTHTQGI